MGSGKSGWKYHIAGVEIRRISEQHVGIIIVIIAIMFPTIMIITGTVIIIIILITLFLLLVSVIMSVIIIIMNIIIIFFVYYTAYYKKIPVQITTDSFQNSGPSSTPSNKTSLGCQKGALNQFPWSACGLRI